MPIQNTTEMNVPLIGPRSRYRILGLSAAWCLQKMATGSTFNGAAPRSASEDTDEIDPVVTGGQSLFDNLTEGGLFTLLASDKKPIVVDEVLNPGSATAVIISRDGLTTRPFPTTTPFRVSPNEVIKVSGGTAASLFGVLVRIDGENQP